MALASAQRGELGTTRRPVPPRTTRGRSPGFTGSPVEPQRTPAEMEEQDCLLREECKRGPTCIRWIRVLPFHHYRVLTGRHGLNHLRRTGWLLVRSFAITKAVGQTSRCAHFEIIVGLLGGEHQSQPPASGRDPGKCGSTPRISPTANCREPKASADASTVRMADDRRLVVLDGVRVLCSTTRSTATFQRFIRVRTPLVAHILAVRVGDDRWLRAAMAAISR